MNALPYDGMQKLSCLLIILHQIFIHLALYILKVKMRPKAIKTKLKRDLKIKIHV